MTELGWRVNLLFCYLAGKAPAITKDTARTAQTVSRYSADKFSRQFNYRFTPLKEAIENTARWFKAEEQDRKSTRLNSSHVRISYAVFCLKKKKKKHTKIIHTTNTT